MVQAFLALVAVLCLTFQTLLFFGDVTTFDDHNHLQQAVSAATQLGMHPLFGVFLYFLPLVVAAAILIPLIIERMVGRRRP